MTKTTIPSLRERKKEMIRQEVIKAAKRLFEKHGYDAVTVAEIADAANISVKTLFTYFRSKDDLLFQDRSLLEEILKDLKARKSKSPAKTVAATLIRLMKEEGRPADSLAAFQKGYGNSDALQARLSRLWAEYEDAIVKQFAAEQGFGMPTVDLRFLAGQLVFLVKALTWKEMHEMAHKNRNNSLAVLSAWLERKAKAIDTL